MNLLLISNNYNRVYFKLTTYQKVDTTYDNHVVIESYDELKKEIKGYFNAKLLVDQPKKYKNAKDELIFKNMKFEARIP